MQEEVTQKTMALAITTSRMTASVLAKAMRKFLEAQKNKSHQLPKGKQTLKELMKHNTGVSNLEITNANIRAFSATAKKYGIDFALKKDSSTQPPRYLVFFKGRDADVMTAAFKEFSAKQLSQEKKPSIRKLLSSMKELAQKKDMSSLPLGLNQVNIKRSLTTSSTAIFVPFTTQELFQGGEALYYGLNALSGNMIMADRKQLKNPNGLILGTPGSGKSFSAKREITNVFLVASKKDTIIICDPEAEYAPLVNRLGGQVVKISPTSKDYVNPMDLNLNYSEDESPLALKSDFILSLCELIVGGKDGLQPIEKTIIDRAVTTVYRGYLADPRPENMPVLGNLYEEIQRQPELEAARIAAALELYVTGSLNIFNHRTNVDIQNRLVCFDIKELGKQLKKLGMLIIQDQVWGRVTENRELHANTWFYCDEFHLLLKEEQTAAYSVEIWKRFRKWGGIPTGITQNIKDLLASREIENIFENSDFVYMLNQAAGDREILAKKLGISPQQLSYVTHSGPGEGLIFYGNVILPFVDRFPQDTELYRIMTTKPEEVIDP